MRWIKIVGVCVVVLVAINVILAVLGMIEWLIIIAALVGIIVVAIRIYDFLCSTRTGKVHVRKAKEAQATANRSRLSVEEELERLKRDMA